MGISAEPEWESLKAPFTIFESSTGGEWYVSLKLEFPVICQFSQFYNY